jgi:hypothetical protein
VTTLEALKEFLARPAGTIIVGMDEENGIPYEITNIDFEHAGSEDRPHQLVMYMREKM